MTDVFEDKGSVESSISLTRERHAARRSALKAGAEGGRKAKAGSLKALPSAPPSPPPGVLAQKTMAVQSVPQSPPPDAATYYRQARFGVVGVILLALIWLWIRERRNGVAVSG